MRQLLLDLLPKAAPSLENFVPSGNVETLAALSGWLAPERARGESSFLLWGATGSGKTHLLLASGFPYHDARREPGLAALPEVPAHLAVDHVESLSPAGEQALFNAFNRARAAGGRLLVAASVAPAHLPLREDLRTRLASGALYALSPLTDEEKIAALCAQARARAVRFPREAADYLLRHAPRDMRSLSALMAALTDAALEQQHPITLPFLRNFLRDLLSAHGAPMTTEPSHAPCALRP
ncbi:MAG: DnaA regulatory inactivator Hda [Zoogloeaceae bacterium]|jgi:DnaA family protein|nr:DnaA regulatory inactivator Hda [Zoogloeaceae bacterium]